jgi:hypothetical protein
MVDTQTTQSFIYDKYNIYWTKKYIILYFIWLFNIFWISIKFYTFPNFEKDYVFIIVVHL